jgi:hypothetical protein
MPERRKLKRRHLLYYLRVYNADTRRLVGHLVDITPDGVLIMSDQAIRLGRSIRLRMNLPGPPRDNQALEFQATSLWRRRDVNPDFWDTGFQTMDLSRKQAVAIETLIEDYGFRD